MPADRLTAGAKYEVAVTAANSRGSSFETRSSPIVYRPAKDSADKAAHEAADKKAAR